MIKPIKRIPEFGLTEDDFAIIDVLDEVNEELELRFNWINGDKSEKNPILTTCFRDMLAAMLKGVISAKLITRRFHEKYKDILCEENGILVETLLTYEEVYELGMDITELIFNPLLTCMGLFGESPDFVEC